MNLDPSLAYTALGHFWPGWDTADMREMEPVINELAAALTAANPKDRWSYAQAWIADRVAVNALAKADERGAPYTVPVTAPIDYRMALAIARSAHPSRVLANTDGYRYGRFTEHDGVVDVHMMGSHIARFWPHRVQLWSRGWSTVSTSEALSALVTGGYFYTDKGTLTFSAFETTGSHRTGTPHREGQPYDYKKGSRCSGCGCPEGH